MGGDAGLILGLGIDPSGSKEGLSEFDRDLDSATQKWHDDFEKAADGTEPLDKALIGNRETVRLLSEDFGLHLPRAVTGAIGQMLPQIASMGTALLGVFAVEEAIKFGKEVMKLADDFNEVAEAEKAMKAAQDENLKAMESAAKASKEYAQGQLALLSAQIVAGEMSVQNLREQEEGLNAINPIIGNITQAYRFLTGHSKDLKEAEAGLNEVYKMRDALIKILGDDETKAHKDATKAAADQAEADYRAAVQKYEANQKAFHASEEALKRLMALQDHLGRQAVEAAHKEEQAREHAAVAVRRLTEELRKQGEQEARNAEALGKEVSRQIADITRIGDEQKKAALRGKEEARQRIEDQHQAALKAIQDHNAEAQAIAQLKGDYKAMADAAIAAYTAMGQANANYLKQLTEQHKAEQKAANDATNAEIADIGTLAEGAAELIGSKKAYYAVKAAEEVAAGLECLAEGTWPPNPLAWIASGIHFESAAEYAKIAGTSARGSSGGGGAAGYGGGAPGRGGEIQAGESSYRSSPGAGESSPAFAGTGLAPGAAGSSSGRLNVIVLGEAEQARFFADRVNAADAAGHFMQVSTARRGAPAQG